MINAAKNLLYLLMSHISPLFFLTPRSMKSSVVMAIKIGTATTFLWQN